MMNKNRGHVLYPENGRQGWCRGRSEVAQREETWKKFHTLSIDDRRAWGLCGLANGGEERGNSYEEMAESRAGTCMRQSDMGE
jgi:hypothetical protein